MQLINDQIHKKLLAITQFYQPSPMGTGEICKLHMERLNFFFAVT